jgi:hypothetical protein
LQGKFSKNKEIFKVLKEIMFFENGSTDHACKCFHLEEKVCGKLKFEAILGKFIFGCGSTIDTDYTKWRPVVRKI